MHGGYHLVEGIRRPSPVPNFLTWGAPPQGPMLNESFLLWSLHPKPVSVFRVLLVRRPSSWLFRHRSPFETSHARWLIFHIDRGAGSLVEKSSFVPQDTKVHQVPNRNEFLLLVNCFFMMPMPCFIRNKISYLCSRKCSRFFKPGVGAPEIGIEFLDLFLWFLWCLEDLVGDPIEDSL